MTDAPRPRVVIVGAGFAGIACAARLARQPVDVVLIDRRNHHLFQPLLYQVATAALAPADVATPIRHMLRHAENVTVFWDEVTGIDRTGQAVLTGTRRVAYDYLVLATGARHSYFGRDDWAEHAPGLKSLEDAFLLRHRVLGAFERAEMETDPAAREALLEFVIVGAGPTGVELAGAVAELSRRSLTRDFRRVTPACARIRLVEAGPRILPAFDPRLAAVAAENLADMGVEVQTDTRVTEIGAGRVRLGETELRAETVIWAAGVQASPAGRWLGVETDRAGRVAVDEALRVPGEGRIFVVGDTAAHRPGGAERPLPGVAPVAKQMGAHAARVIAAAVAGAAPPAPFRYRDWGAMATIGRNKAVAEIGGLRLTGFAAWLLWSAAHVAFLEGMKNRISVGLSWAWSYLTWERGARLIIGSGEAPAREG